MSKNEVLAIIGTAIALIGGVPGFIGLLNHIRSRAALHVELAHMISGELNGRFAVLLTVTVSNRGRDPITPVQYDLDCHLGRRGGWLRFERRLIPADLTFASGGRLEGEVADHDLQQKTVVVQHAQPVVGHLLFVSDAVGQPQFIQARDDKRLRMWILCVDVLGRNYKHKLKLDLNPVRSPMVFPHHGIVVQPDDDAHRPR